MDSFTSSHYNLPRELLSVLPIFGCWIIWTSRCSAYYDGIRLSLHDIIYRFKDLLSSCVLRMPFQSSIVLPSHLSFLPIKQFRRTFLRLHWTFQPPASYKLNVDGSSVLQSQHSGGGVVIRRDDGSVVHASSHYFGPGNSLQAELLALLHGLEICQQLSLDRVMVEMDSLLVVSAISKGHNWPWKYHYQFYKATQLLNHPHVSLSHVFRECNAVADSLAKLATASMRTTSFQMNSLPSYIRGLINLDRVHYPYVRVRRSF